MVAALELPETNVERMRLEYALQMATITPPREWWTKDVSMKLICMLQEHNVHRMLKLHYTAFRECLPEEMQKQVDWPTMQQMTKLRSDLHKAFLKYRYVAPRPAAPPKPVQQILPKFPSSIFQQQPQHHAGQQMPFPSYQHPQMMRQQPQPSQLAVTTPQAFNNHPQQRMPMPQPPHQQPGLQPAHILIPQVRPVIPHQPVRPLIPARPQQQQQMALGMNNSSVALHDITNNHPQMAHLLNPLLGARQAIPNPLAVAALSKTKATVDLVHPGRPSIPTTTTATTASAPMGHQVMSASSASDTTQSGMSQSRPDVIDVEASTVTASAMSSATFTNKEKKDDDDDVVILDTPPVSAHPGPPKRKSLLDYGFFKPPTAKS